MELKQSRMDKHDIKNRSIESLRSLISETQDPVFIIDVASDTILVANNSEVSACGSPGSDGKSIHSLIHMETSDGLVFFNNKWHYLKKQQFRWNNKNYFKLILKHPGSVPDDSELVTIRNMIAVLLHRLRSPMTGMRGYLEMVETVSDKKDQHKLSKVSEGLDYLFEILNELERLHYADATIQNELEADSSRAENVIRDVLSQYDSDLKQRVSVLNKATGSFKFNEAELRQILTILIQNAAEHYSGSDSPIRIEVESSRKISVTNWGNPIPEDIVSKLYFPFITTKANSLGIGLSLAQIIARRRQAIILLSGNDLDKGIQFTLYCPPASFS